MKFLSKDRHLFSENIKKGIVVALFLVFSLHFHIFADENQPDAVVSAPEMSDVEAFDIDSLVVEQPVAPIEVAADSTIVTLTETEPKAMTPKLKFNPDPNRALWLSALCPGLGQIYNRRYWKVPIVIGGYVGLAYATSWNNRMLSDYTKAYRDIMDSDPSTKSYMDFYPSTTKEEDIDMAWLQRALKSKKDYYRRNRDLCIIGMVGLYFLSMVDAYVDASLSHFDISPDLSLRVSPTIEPQQYGATTFGMNCAFIF